MADIEKVAEAICTSDSHKRIWSHLGPASKSYYRSMAIAAFDALGLVEEYEETVPIWVREFDDDGSPVMCNDMVPPHPKSHIEWVTKRRLVTPWEEIGDRQTSQRLSARLEANRDSP